MMNKIILILIIIITCFSCSHELVTIQVITRFNENKVEVPKKIEEFEVLFLHQEVREINGITQLKNLKKISFIHIYGISDYQFIEKLKKLEILKLIGCNIDNFKFLHTLKDLRVLFLEGITINNVFIDFTKNNKLEYLELRNIYLPDNNKKFELKLKHLPKTLIYVRLVSNNLFINEKLLESFKQVKYVFMLKNETNAELINKYPNITFESIENILPEQYKSAILFKKPKYMITPNN